MSSEEIWDEFYFACGSRNITHSTTRIAAGGSRFARATTV